MRKYLLFFILIFSSNLALKAEIESIHDKCLKANDYEGCVKVLESKNFKKQNVDKSIELPKSKNYAECINELKIIQANEKNFENYVDKYGSISQSSLLLACESMNDVSKEYNFTDLNKACFITGSDVHLKTKDKLIKKAFNPKNVAEYCKCYESKYDKRLAWSDLKNEKIGFSCSLTEIYTFLNGGYRFFKPDFLVAVFHNRDNTWDYSLNDSSVKQKKIRKSYGRYITFYGKTNNPFEGDYIPEKPGFIDCDWGGSGSAYYDEDYGQGSWSSGGSCYGEEGTSEKIIPGGIDKTFYKYTLDCQDRTFDRKGDRVSYDGIAKKGWMNIWNDPTAVMAADIYCPIISNLPKE